MRASACTDGSSRSSRAVQDVRQRARQRGGVRPALEQLLGEVGVALRTGEHPLQGGLRQRPAGDRLAELGQLVVGERATARGDRPSGAATARPAPVAADDAGADRRCGRCRPPAGAHRAAGPAGTAGRRGWTDRPSAGPRSSAPAGFPPSRTPPSTAAIPSNNCSRAAWSSAAPCGAHQADVEQPAQRRSSCDRRFDGVGDGPQLGQCLGERQIRQAHIAEIDAMTDRRPVRRLHRRTRPSWSAAGSCRPRRHRTPGSRPVRRGGHGRARAGISPTRPCAPRTAIQPRIWPCSPYCQQAPTAPCSSSGRVSDPERASLRQRVHAPGPDPR